MPSASACYRAFRAWYRFSIKSNLRFTAPASRIVVLLVVLLMEDEVRRAVLEGAYDRIRQRLKSKDVTAEHLRSVALEALGRARIQMELDPGGVAEELTRLQNAPEPEPEPEPE